jgi:hypothetical protein
MRNPNEAVDHPPHYFPGKHEVIDVIEAWGLGFSLGNAVKYIARHALKGDAVTNLRKARWYIDRHLANLGDVAPTPERPVDDELARARLDLAAEREARAHAEAAASAAREIEAHEWLKPMGVSATYGQIARSLSAQGRLAALKEFAKYEIQKHIGSTDGLAGHAAQLETALKEARAELDGATQALAAAKTERDAARRALAEAQHEVEALRKIRAVPF